MVPEVGVVMGVVTAHWKVQDDTKVGMVMGVATAHQKG